MHFSPLDLYSLCQCRVERHTCEPIVKGKLNVQCLFTWMDWAIFAFNRLSCTSMTSTSRHLIMCQVSTSATVAEEVAGTKGRIIWGLWPIHSWNGEKPVELLTVFIMSKRMRGRAHTQPLWFLSTWYWSTWLTILFVHLLAPSDSGWYAVDIFSLMPVSLCKAFQNLDMNSLLRSETISVGRPFLQYHLSKNKYVRSSAVMSVLIGTSCISLPKQSVRVMMQFLLLSSGSGPIKLIATESLLLSGMGRGWSQPYGLIVDDLFHWQSGQEGT